MSKSNWKYKKTTLEAFYENLSVKCADILEMNAVTL